jgi:hypothetical protein
MIDWSIPESRVSKYFTVQECIFLHLWNRLATEDDGLTDAIKVNLIQLCQGLDVIREFLGVPMTVHCMYRSPEYSKLVGGFATDVHTTGQAIDFDCQPDLTCDEVRAKLLPKLLQFDLRMEKNPGKGWIHLDDHPVIHQRYFNP